jgi:rhodanese-related sulfurtransferase
MVNNKLCQLFHEYNTNAVEGFNKYLTTFLHKDKTFCQSIENAARSYLAAAALQSIGFRQCYERAFELTGIKMKRNDMTSLFL